MQLLTHIFVKSRIKKRLSKQYIAAGTGFTDAQNLNSISTEFCHF